MRKTLIVVSLLVVTAIVVAAPKTQSVASCLWTYAGSILTPADGKQVYLYPNNGVGIGESEFWYGPPAEGELVVGRRGINNIAQLSSFWWDDVVSENTQIGLIARRHEAYLRADSGEGQELLIGFRANNQSQPVPTIRVGNNVSITAGADAPSADEPDGSLYLRAGVGLYVRESGSWVLK